MRLSLARGRGESLCRLRLVAFGVFGGPLNLFGKAIWIKECDDANLMQHGALV